MFAIKIYESQKYFANVDLNIPIYFIPPSRNIGRLIKIANCISNLKPIQNEYNTLVKLRFSPYLAKAITKEILNIVNNTSSKKTIVIKNLINLGILFNLFIL
jgi:pyruvate/2-oxoglutarate dehydrogenase complex dihydrolipoamide acyltransferase (E2) component